MIRDDASVSGYRRRSRWRSTVTFALVAFCIGMVVMAVGIKYYRGSWPWHRDIRTASIAVPASTGTQTAPANSAVETAPVTDLNTLAAREAALSARLSDLEARAATIDSQAQAASGNATRAEGLLIAFAARRALDRGLGLGYIEGQLRERFGATQPRAVATVIQASRAPVTIEDLRLGLTSIAPDLMTSSRSQGWWASFRGAFSNLIVIRKADTPSPRPTDRLERARRLLDGGQVEAALAEVSQLPGASKADAWTSAARRYVEARHALDVIETAAIMGQARQPALETQPQPPQPAPAANPPANPAAPTTPGNTTG